MNRILLPALLTVFTAACTPDGAQRMRIGGTDGNQRPGIPGMDAAPAGPDGQISQNPDAGPPPPDDGGGNTGPDRTTPPPDDGGPIPGNPDATPGPPGDAGMPVGPMPLGPLGQAPGGNFSVIAALDIQNDQMVARSSEVAFSGIPIPRGLNMSTTDGLVVVGPGGSCGQGGLPGGIWSGPFWGSATARQGPG